MNNSAKNFTREINRSMRNEIREIYQHFEFTRMVEARSKGLCVYHVKNKDAYDFMSADVRDRMAFGQETGLFPNL